MIQVQEVFLWKVLCFVQGQHLFWVFMNVFFAMAVGRACGMGQLVFAAIVTVIISLAMLILTKSRFGEKRGDWKHLKIVIPENLDYHIILKDVRKEKEMIDEIRCRNGNLSITCGRRVQDGLEL